MVIEYLDINIVHAEIYLIFRLFTLVYLTSFLKELLFTLGESRIN